ncbi:hypothetical protein FQZ97_931960 [compost metagenome]
MAVSTAMARPARPRSPTCSPNHATSAFVVTCVTWKFSSTRTNRPPRTSATRDLWACTTRNWKNSKWPRPSRAMPPWKPSRRCWPAMMLILSRHCGPVPLRRKARLPIVRRLSARRLRNSPACSVTATTICAMRCVCWPSNPHATIRRSNTTMHARP